MNNLTKRFIKYVKIDTQSAYNAGVTPSTSGQMELARMLAEELKSIGLENVELDKNGYVMAELPANINKKVPTVGFIAHVDTTPEFNGKDVNPQIVENYDGGDIILNKKENIVLSPNDFPELKNYVGQTLITTDGTTLLGADDKAGVAEIVTALEYLVNNPEIPHGKVRVCFTPDEEIGDGADHFDVKKFGADFAYTLDGGEIGELNCENFNAAYAKITIKGRDAHPGDAKDKMINSMLIANQFISSLPNDEIPQNTEGYEGFFHLMSVEGNVGETTLQYIIRDFDTENQEKRKHLIRENCKKTAERYGKKNVELEMRDQYYNMRKKIEPVKHIVEIARKAMEDVGITPKIIPIRGGTDGCRLSFKGLPTPNIFDGGHNFHGRFEYIPVKSMEKAVEVIIKIVENIAK